MRTKWELIYVKTIVFENYHIEYDCYYDDEFNILYRSVYVCEIVSLFPKENIIKFVEIVDSKFHGIEKSINYWKVNSDEYTKIALDKI